MKGSPLTKRLSRKAYQRAHEKAKQKGKPYGERNESRTSLELQCALICAILASSFGQYSENAEERRPLAELDVGNTHWVSSRYHSALTGGYLLAISAMASSDSRISLEI